MATINRVAFVSPRYAEGSTIGGAETLLKQLALRCAQTIPEVHVLTTCATNHYTWENELEPGEQLRAPLHVHFFPVDLPEDREPFFRIQNDISAGVKVSREDEARWFADNVNSEALCRHLQDGQYDRIIVGPYLFGLTLRAARVNPDRTVLVPCLHDEAFAYLPTFKELFKSVRCLMFNSSPEQELAERLYDVSGVAKHVVGMGLDPFHVTPGAFRKQHGIETPYLLYSGRREPLKGTPLLLHYLDVFRTRTGRDVSLVLTGAGSFEPPPGLSPHILDLGFVTEEEKQAAMADALAFCHPSTNESFGIVLLESWLAGRPGIVHAESAVLKDHCQKSNGGVWFRHYPDFETILLKLLDTPDLADAMGRSGNAYVRKCYSWEAIDKRLMTALQQ